MINHALVLGESKKLKEVLVAVFWKLEVTICLYWHQINIDCLIVAI